MQLVRSLVEYPFLGLDQKTEAKTVMPGKLLRAENAIYLKKNEISKRNGYSAFSTALMGDGGGNLTTGQRLATLNNELLQLSNGALSSWAQGPGQWTSKGNISPATVAATPIVANTYQQSSPDMAIASDGTIVYAWVDSRGGVWAGVFDNISGSAIIPEKQLDANGSNPRCVALGLSLVILYLSTVGGICTIKSRIVTLANRGVISGATNVLADANATTALQHLDVAASSLFPTAAVFTYNSSAGVSGTVRVGYVRYDGSLGSPMNGGLPPVATLAGQAGANGLSVVVQAGGDAYILWTNGGGSYFAAIYGLTFLQKVAPTLVEAIAPVNNITGAFDAAGNLNIIYEAQGNAGYAYNEDTRIAVWSAVGAQVKAPADLRRSVGLAGKAFLHPATGVHVLTVHDSTTAAGLDGVQNTYFLLNVNGRVEGRLQPSLAGKLQTGQIPSIVTLDGTNFLTIFQVRTKFISQGNTTYTLFGLTQETITFSGAAYRSAAFGAALLFAGAVVGEYDGGSAVIENGFHLYPENMSVVLAGGGGNLTAGFKQIMFCWEWVDNKGQEHRSTPSQVFSFTALANDIATFTVPSLRLTDKVAPRTNITLAGYMTQTNQNIFYKVCGVNGQTDPTKYPVYNDPTMDNITFVANTSDANIVGDEVIYTEGGILGNDAAQPSAQISVSQNRAFLLSAENRKRFYLTKQFQRGEAPAFSDYLYIDVDPIGGDCTAGWNMDSNFLIFKNHQIEVLSGDGPDDGGNNNTFSTPVIVTTDVGCTNPDSLATVPQGIVFQSDKGMYLLDRSLRAEYLGNPVEDLVAGATITSATLVEGAQEVRFTTSGSTATPGVTNPTLVWNYFFNEWSVWIHPVAPVHAMVWQSTGLWCFLTAAGVVMQETPGLFLDAGLPIHMTCETAWLKMAGIQGFQRARSAIFLGNFFSPHLVQVQVAYDYQDFSQQYSTWDPVKQGGMGADVYGGDSPFGGPPGAPFGGGEVGGGSGVYQYKVPLKRQKCQAIRFLITDVGDNVGEAYSLVSLALEVAVKTGGARVSVGKTANTT